MGGNGGQRTLSARTTSALGTLRHYQTSTLSTTYGLLSQRTRAVLSRSEEAATRSPPPGDGHALLKPAVPPNGACCDQRALIGWKFADGDRFGGRKKEQSAEGAFFGCREGKCAGGAEEEPGSCLLPRPAFTQHSGQGTTLTAVFYLPPFGFTTHSTPVPQPTRAWATQPARSIRESPVRPPPPPNYHITSAINHSRRVSQVCTRGPGDCTTHHATGTKLTKHTQVHAAGHAHAQTEGNDTRTTHEPTVAAASFFLRCIS